MNSPNSQLWTPPIAASQAGAFTRAQAIAGGLTQRQVAYRLKAGTFQNFVGVALRHRNTPETPQMLAHGTFLTWPNVILCGPTAAALSRVPVLLTAAHVITQGRPNPIKRIIPHEFDVAPWERDTWNGIQITTLSRSLIDAIILLPEPAAHSLFVWSITRDRLSIPDLEIHLEHYPGRWGNNRLRRFLLNAQRGIMSPAEELLQKILKQNRLTGWQADVAIRRERKVLARVDVLFPAERVVVEVDGRRYHGEDRFQADRTRDNLLLSAGYLVLRFTWEDLTRRPREVVTRIGQALALSTTAQD